MKAKPKSKSTSKTPAHSLTAQQEALSSFFDKAPFPIALFKGSDMMPVAVNDSFMRLISKKKSEFLGKSLFDTLPEASSILKPIAHKVLKTGEPFIGNEFPLLLNRSGSTEQFYFNFVWEPYRESDNKITGIIAIATDVTEQVKAKKTAEDSEERFRNLVKQASVGIVVIKGTELIATVANDYFCELIGVQYEELIGRQIFEVDPDNEPSFRPIIEEVMSTGKSKKFTDYHFSTRANGVLREYYLDLIYKPYIDTDGSVSGVMGVIIDVTSKVNSRKLLEYAEEKARLAVGSGGLGTYELYLATNDMYTDKRFQDIWGYDRSMTRMELAANIVSEDQIIRQRAHEEALITGRLSYEARITWKDGSLHWIRVMGSVFYDDDNKPFKILGVIQDITEQKLYSEALQRQVELRTRELEQRTFELDKTNQELHRSNSDLEQFAFIASHDLQEPLRKVMTYTSMLEQSLGTVGKESRMYLDKITSSSERMIKLIKDVLSFSQLSIERPPLVKQDLNELVRSALNDFDLLIEQKNAVVTVDPLPVVLGIPGQLHQLFGNLLSNALKFTSSETQPRVKVTYVPSQPVEVQSNPALLTGYQYAHIMVSDNGIGFDRVHSKQIFQIFQRLHTKNKYAGTGIGLAMCKKIAENHHGDIFAEPNERQGSTFHVLLPINETSTAKNGY